MLSFLLPSSFSQLRHLLSQVENFPKLSPPWLPYIINKFSVLTLTS